MRFWPLPGGTVHRTSRVWSRGATAHESRCPSLCPCMSPACVSSMCPCMSPACVPACVTSVCPCVSPVCVPACVPVCHWRVPACVTSVCPCVSLACVPACVTGVCPSTAVRLDFSCSPMVGRGWCVSCVLLSGVLRLCGPIWTCLLDRRRLAGRHASDWPSPHYPVLSMQVVSDTSVLEIRLYFLRHLLVISLGYITSSLCKSP